MRSTFTPSLVPVQQEMRMRLARVPGAVNK